MDDLPLAPLWMGLGLLVGYGVLWLAFQNLAGTLHGFRLSRVLPAQTGQLGQLVWESPFGWFEAVNGVLITYLLAAVFHVRRGAARDLRELRSALRWTDAEFEERSRRILVLGKWERVAVCIGGIAVGLAITFFDPGMWDDHNRPRIGDPFLGLISLRMSLLAVAFALLTLCDFKLARSFFRLGRRDVEIDLSNLRPLAPFARRGLRSVVIWMLALMIFSLFFFAPVRAGSNILTVAYCLLFAGVVFLLSVLGVRHSIMTAKARELARLSRAIHQERERLLPGDAVDPMHSTTTQPIQDTRLVNLVAYRDMIEGAREWPFGASTWARLLLFMALGVGSWVGGAVVERILSTALE